MYFGARLFLLFFLLSLLNGQNVYADAANEEVEQIVETPAADLRLIGDRMKSLSQSLDNMPQIPKLNQKIVLPDETNESGDQSAENREEL